MAIAATDIAFYHPATRTEGSSHGGTCDYGTATSCEIATTKNGLWDDVSGDEASAGDTEYRKIFVGLKTTAGSQILSNPVIFIASTTPATGDEIEILMSTASADYSNVQSDITGATTWSTPTTKTDGLSLHDIQTGAGTGGAAGVWLRRVVSAGAGSYADNSFTLQVEGETV